MLVQLWRISNTMSFSNQHFLEIIKIINLIVTMFKAYCDAHFLFHDNKKSRPSIYQIKPGQGNLHMFPGLGLHDSKMPRFLHEPYVGDPCNPP